MSGGIGVQRDGLRADSDAEVDLGAGWGDDLATADDPRAVRLRAGDVGRERHGLASERRNAQPRRQQAGERTQTVDPRLISIRAFSRRFFGTCTVLLLGFFSSRTRIRPCDIARWNHDSAVAAHRRRQIRRVWCWTELMNAG